MLRDDRHNEIECNDYRPSSYSPRLCTTNSTMLNTTRTNIVNVKGRRNFMRTFSESERTYIAYFPQFEIFETPPKCKERREKEYGRITIEQNEIKSQIGDALTTSA